MIRNVVLVELRPDADPDEIAAIQVECRALECPGTIAYTQRVARVQFDTMPTS